jgi:hypothetical protein
MRTAFALTAVALVLAALALLVAFFRGLPVAESDPAPRPETLRRVAVIGPPTSLRARLKARLRICPREGHQWGIAYPMAGSQRIRQCRRCGKIEEPTVVNSYRTERA